MAGGLGERLRPFTEVLPKPLLPLGDKSVIEILIGKMKESGVNEVILSIFYKSDLFEPYLGNGSKYGIKINYSKEEKLLGTAGPLANMKDILTEPFIVSNGDILTNIKFDELMKFHKENNADITIVTKSLPVPLNYGVISSVNNEVTNLEEKPVLNFEINAGIYALSPNMLDLLKTGEFIHMTELLKLAKVKGMRVMRYLLDGYWLDMGIIGDYERARNDIKDGKI